MISLRVKNVTFLRAELEKLRQTVILKALRSQFMPIDMHSFSELLNYWMLICS